MGSLQLFFLIGRYICVMKKFAAILLILGVFVTFHACQDDPMDIPDDNRGDLTDIAYEPEFVDPPRPPGYPEMVIPEDNPLTEAGIELGRHLFYDPILSRDSTIACATCHFPSAVFSDNNTLAIGIDGQVSPRSSMSLLDVGFFNNGLFWDGRAETLEEQVPDPIVNPLEMHAVIPDVINDLQVHSDYPTMMRKAFGINNTDEISIDHVSKSVSQFMRMITSSGTSKYDRVFAPGSLELFSDEELNGYDMFFDISFDVPDAECGHCHNAPLFTTNQFFNNGLQEDQGNLTFADNGRGKITGRRIDNGKMRAPSLRNIALRTPYMHDGSLKTLEEVVDHYDSGGHPAENRDPLIRPLGLTEEQKSDLIAFLHTLTDTAAINNPRLSNPFQ